MEVTVKFDKRELERMRQVCAEIGYDDGLDTRRSRRDRSLIHI